MNSPLSTAAPTHDNEPKMKDEQLRQSPMEVEVEVDFDTYTDDDSSESSPRGVTSPNGMGTGVWSKEEHAKFLDAIKIYTNGPWKLVAAYVGTRTVRQTMTHAQKYRQKAARRLRGLRTKQALMRMHFGHHVSEESLVQERLRSMSTANRNNYHRIAFPSNYAMPHPRNSYLQGTEPLPSEVSPWFFTQEPAYLNTTMLDVEEIDLLEDLTASPSLEECATELLNLLF